MYTSFNYYEEVPIREMIVQNWIECYVQGKLLSVKAKNNIPYAHQEHKQGLVAGFSPSAHLRLLKFIATVKWEEIPRASFITLTYPDKYAMRTRSQRLKDRYRFWRSMEKDQGQKLCGIWRTEWKRRKMGTLRGKVVPHFHLLAFHTWSVNRWTVLRAWRAALQRKGKLMVDWQPMYDGEHAAQYVAKYCGKVSEANDLDNPSYLNSNGRHYGYTRRGMIPRHEKVFYRDITEDELNYLLWTAAEKIPKFDPNNPTNFSLLGQAAIDAAKNLGILELTKRRAVG